MASQKTLSHREFGFAPVLILLIIAAGIGLFVSGTYFGKTLQIVPKSQTQFDVGSYNPTEAPQPVSSIPSSWKTFKSNFSYSFKYPADWYFHPYEETPGSLGTHTLLNYDWDEIENYMDHGIVDWKAFGKTAVRLEFTNISFDFPETKFDGTSDITVNSVEEYIEKVVFKTAENSILVRDPEISFKDKTYYALKVEDDAGYSIQHFVILNEKTLLVVGIRADNFEGDFEQTDLFRTVKQIVNSLKFN